MNLDLKHLGDAGNELDGCEAAITEGAFMSARDALDRADAALTAVRGQWRDLGVAERKLLASVAKPVSERRDELAARIPQASVVSEGAAEPEEAEDGNLDELTA